MCPALVRRCRVEGKGMDSARWLPGFEIVALPLGCITWAIYLESVCVSLTLSVKWVQ